MPYSKTIISNMALAHCGVNARIQDVDNEKSNEANQCRLFFDHIVELVLEACEWPFATVFIPLQSLGDPPDGWAYRYKKPANCKLAIKIVNPATRTEATGQKIPFVIVDDEDGYGECILCDLEAAVLKCNRLILDPGRFTSSFAQAVAMGLASHIAMPLRVDGGIVKNVQNQFNGWLAEAVNFKQREQQEDVEPDSELVGARG